MTVTSVKLVDSGIGEMVLYPREDLVLVSIDPGSPDMREVVEARPDDDGMRDTTTRWGARAVAVEVMTLATPAAILDELTRYLAPSRRPYLVQDDTEWPEARQLQLRSVSWAPPQVADDHPDFRTIQVQWRAPAGAWEAVSEVPVTVRADISSDVGFSAPVVAPIELEETAASGSAQTVNVGGVPSHFVARLYGPCSAPRLVNDLTGEELTFGSTLTLGAGEYVEVDTQAKTALLNSSASQSRLNDVDFAVSSWWQIQPGLQAIRYAPTSPSAGSQAEITYRPRWL